MPSKPNDYVVDAMVSDAIRIVEATPISPPPWVTSMKKPRARPSEQQQAVYDAHVFPSPHWGLNINLSSTYMGIDQASRIARLMLTNTTVTTLDLSMCDIYSEGCEELVKCLKRNFVLRHLSLNGNRIGPRGAVALAEYLGMDDTHERRRMHAAAAPISIFPVAFDGCGEIKATYIPPHQGLNSSPSDFATQPDSTKELSGLAGGRSGGIGDHTSNAQVGVDESVHSAKSYETPRRLYRNLGTSSDEDDLSIAPPSYLRCPLESLSIAHNAIGDEGVIAITNALRHNATLTFLNVRGNHITNLGAFAILDTLADHHTLEQAVSAFNEKAKIAAKNSKRKGKGKTKSATRIPTPTTQVDVTAATSCLPNHLRFDVESLQTERMTKREAPHTPMLFEMLFALTSREGIPRTVTTGGGPAEPGHQIVNKSSETIAVPTGNATSGPSHSNEFMAEQLGAVAYDERVPKAVEVKERWSNMMTVEQKQEILAFMFPQLLSAKGTFPNPLLSEAAAILFDGNATLQLSVLNAALAGATEVKPPMPVVSALPNLAPAYAPFRHRAPTFEENAGGYFYPTVVQCEGRSATLIEPALLAAPNEKVYFSADGKPYTIAFVGRSTALRPHDTFKNAAAIVAASAMQFIQSSYVRALEHNVSSAGLTDLYTSTFTRKTRVHPDELKNEAVKAVADDYHHTSTSLALFGREERAVGQRGPKTVALSEKIMADFDPFSENQSPNHVRFSDNLPKAAPPKDAATVLPKVLQLVPKAEVPLRPSKPISAKSLRRIQPVTSEKNTAQGTTEIPEESAIPSADGPAPSEASPNAQVANGAVLAQLPRRRGSAPVDSIVPDAQPAPHPAFALLPPELLFLESMAYFGGQQRLREMADTSVARLAYLKDHEEDADYAIGGWQVLNSMAPHRSQVVRSDDSHATVIPPFGQLYAQIFRFSNEFPNFRMLADSNSPFSLSPTAWADDVHAPNTPPKVDWAVSPATGGLARRRPIGGAVVPLPLLNSRVQALVSTPAHTESNYGSNVDSALVDRAIVAAKQAYGLWTCESVLLHPVASQMAGTPSDGRRSRGTPLAPSPPPTADRKVASEHAGRPIVCNANVSFSPKKVKTSQNDVAALAEVPHLPIPLPLPRVSIGEVADAAACSLFGSMAVSNALRQWTGSRKDIRSADKACPLEVLRKLVPVSPAVGKDSIDHLQKPASQIRLVLPVEAAPYLPLSHTLVEMMRSPFYVLVDPLTAFLRGRERRVGASATPEAIATAIAFAHRGLGSSSERLVKQPKSGKSSSAAQKLGSSENESPITHGDIEREAILLIGKASTNNFLVSVSSVANPSEGHVGEEGSFSPPPTLDGLLELAQSELEHQGINQDRERHIIAQPTTEVVRNIGLTSVWIETNSVDPILARAIVMALQLRCPPTVPVGFNRKVLKDVLAKRDEAEKAKVYPTAH